jgi:methyltransferase (TIGR00027 family)
MEIESINHVSDTAIWVAMYRAQESKRADAVFHDPFAELLAGQRGKKMVESTPHSSTIGFALVVRTVAIDRLIEKAIAGGVDAVINIGAGLDTRPYRMKLPHDLRWIEIDFEETIQYKTEILKSETPVCKLEFIATDLTKRIERQKLFWNLGRDIKSALIINEGVIWYLTNTQAKELAEDMFTIPCFHYWIMDYAQGKGRRNKQSEDVARNLTNAPWLFNEDDPIKFFGEIGWKPKDNIFILDEADRIGRKMPMSFPWSLLMMFNGIRQVANHTYGYVMFGK